MVPILGRSTFYLYIHATDMRKSFDGLCGLVLSALNQDPLSGAIYVFLNRHRNRMKLLVWDRTGFWIFYKRLEKGTFQLPNHSQDQNALSISYEQLLMILEGIDLHSIKHRPRFQQSPLHNFFKP